MSRFNILRRLLWIPLVLAGSTLSAAATWPNFLNYQGQLTDSSGNAVADNTYSVKFALYNVAAGGSAIWTETQSVAVSKGLFNVVLGTTTPLSSTALTTGSATFTGDLWIGVTVGGDAEMSPRQQLLTSIYARNAQYLAGLQPNNTANNLVVLDGSGKVPSGLVQAGSLSVPLDLDGASATYNLGLLNSSAGSSALGLSVVASSGIAAWASDPTGVGVSVNSLGGVALLAQSASGTALSATSGSSSASLPVAYLSGAYPLRVVVSSAVSNNVGLRSGTPADDMDANLVDRANAAAVYASTSVASAAGVSASASAGTAVQGIGLTGVAGISNSVLGPGVYGTNTAVNGVAIMGRSQGASGGVGVYGRGGGTTTSGNMGVFGSVSGTGSVGTGGYGSNTDSFGVVGTQGNAAPSAGAAGVFGTAATKSVGIGVRGDGDQGVQGNSANTCGVCANNSNASGGEALLASSPNLAVQATSTNNAILATGNNTAITANQINNTSGVGYGVVANLVSTAQGSAAGSFSANGSSGATYGVFAQNNSPAGAAVQATGGSYAVRGKASSAAGNANFLSDVDTSHAPQYGFYHSADATKAPSGVAGGAAGVYSAENVVDGYGGNFANTAADQNSPVGAAVYVQGRIKVAGSANVTQTIVAGSGINSYEFPNAYAYPGCLVLLTPMTPTASVASAFVIAAGTVHIDFTPTLTSNTQYQYLIIGQ